MAIVELKGLHTVRSKGRTYYYAWRGGPRIIGEPGTPEFHASYNEAIVSHSAPDSKKFDALVKLYKASNDYKRLAATTKRTWGVWLDRISDHFGELRIGQFDRPEKIRPIIRRWRGTYAATPRAADTGMQVLSRVLSYAVDPLGKIASNPCEGIKHLYKGDRSEIIWSDSEITYLKESCREEITWAVELAACTGLRESDLLKLTWSHVQEEAIVVTTGKSGHKREAVIPLYQELCDVLARIPKRSPIVLTNSKGKPWTRSGLCSSFNKAKKKAWPDKEARPDRHFHDLRGTAATKFYVAGLSEREIAEILAWEEDNVSRIIKRYVARGAAVRARIRKLDEAKSGT